MLITPREGLWEVTCGITRGMKKKKKPKQRESNTIKNLVITLIDVRI